MVQTTFMLLHYGGLRKRGIVDSVTALATMIAAAVHDFEHLGTNNDFLIKVCGLRHALHTWALEGAHCFPARPGGTFSVGGKREGRLCAHAALSTGDVGCRASTCT